MKLPGPDHPIAVERHPQPVVVTFAGKRIANSTRALRLSESSLAPAFYIPREDVDMAALVRSSHSSHCPYKGDANYFSITVNGRTSDNAVWTYEAPYPAVREIKDHLAFYPERVDSIQAG